MEEFKINQYLTLKLEAERDTNNLSRQKTIIYVAGERFQQCSQLVLNILTTEINAFDEI